MEKPPHIHTSAVEPQFVAGNLALDFINTEFGVDDDYQDCLTNDVQVTLWLERAGLAFHGDIRKGKAGDLITAALNFRWSARYIVEQRKKGEWANVAEINKVLSYGNAYNEVTWTEGSEPVMKLHRRLPRVESLLVPVAESLAHLLATADFNLVRTCESDDCTLWFVDQTKSHHRRWCSAAVCGNREKVAAFRARQKVK